MSQNLTDEMRAESSKLPLTVGAVLFCMGALLSFFGSSWGIILTIPGVLLLVYAALSYGTIFTIGSASNLADHASQKALSDWDGEVLHTDGGRHKIRYKFGHDGSPRFVANDICNSIGAKPPNKDASKWGGAALLSHDGLSCFSRDSVQAYLTPLAVNNHDANRLLLRLKNEVFRKLDKQRGIT